MVRSEKYEVLFKGFCKQEELNSKLASLMEETDHVHFSHPEMWKRDGEFKDFAASKLALIIQEDRALTRNFLGLNDRVVSMLTYRALELLESGADLGDPL